VVQGNVIRNEEDLGNSLEPQGDVIGNEENRGNSLEPQEEREGKM
jgi:hypothetical protein